MKRVLSVLLVAAIIIPSLLVFGDFASGNGFRAAPPGGSIGPNIPDWTLLVWMANDNSPTLPWQDDIDEMMAANTSASIVVLYDGNESADSRLFSVQAGKIANLTAPFFSTEINTGSPFQLSDFVVWGMQNYPSHHVWVDLWGHGNGWKGTCRDIHPSDILTPSELGRAFGEIRERTGKNVDILTFDACRMGAMSVLYELQGSVDYVLSSEMDVPERGLPYTIILNNLVRSPEETARVIVDKYVRWASVNSAYSVTYSSANMSLFPLFMDDFNDYVHLATSLLSYRYGEIWRARNNSEKYQAPAMYDLRDFIKHMRGVDYLLDGRGKELMDSYNRTFFEMHYSNEWSGLPGQGGDGIKAKNAGGMSIYFPIQAFSDYTRQAFYGETAWGGFLAAMERRYSPGSANMSVNYSILRSEVGTGSISLSIRTEGDTPGQSVTAYLLEDGKLIGETKGFPNITIRPERPGNYSILVYLWRNGSLYAERELEHINVTAVLKLYGLIHTTSGKTLMGGITVRNPEGEEIVTVSNESGYSVSVEMPSFCNMGDTLEVSTSIGREEVVHTITVSDYSMRSNFIVADGYGNDTDSGSAAADGGQNIYFVSALASLQLIALGLIALDPIRRRK